VAASLTTEPSEQIVALIRTKADKINEMAPCKLLIHVPPADSKELPKVEITAKL